MDLTVRFCGLCLFDLSRKEDGAVTVYLPRTSGMPPLVPNPGSGSGHGVPAPHGACLIMDAELGRDKSPSTSSSELYPLFGTSIGMPELEGQLDDSQYTSVLKANEVCPDLSLSATPTRSAWVARVELRGGKLKVQDSSDQGLNFEVPGDFGGTLNRDKIGHDIIWEGTTRQGQDYIQLTHAAGKPISLPLPDSGAACIANLRYEHGGGWPLFGREPCSPGEMPMGDFVWYYQLFDIPPGATKGPVPFADCSSFVGGSSRAGDAGVAKAVTTETCFPVDFP